MPRSGCSAFCGVNPQKNPVGLRWIYVMCCLGRVFSSSILMAIASFLLLLIGHN